MLMDADRPTIIHLVNTLDGGGTERTLVALLRALDPARCRHVVVALREAGALAAGLPEHVACRPLNACGQDRLAPLRLARVLTEERAAIVHARNTGSWFDALAACTLRPRTSLVLGFHGLERGGVLSIKHRRVARWAVRQGARLASVCHSGRRQLERECDVAAERIVVLPNGIDTERYSSVDPNSRATGRAAFGFDDAAFVVGAVGSLTPVKRFDLLIDAVSDLRPRHPQVRLLLVGEGPLRNDLTRHAKERGVDEHVRFAGRREYVPSVLQAMDAYVCSSDSEGMSNALLEAMASGVPVVTTNVGDHALIVRDGMDGFVIRPGDSAAVAKRVSQWISHPEQRARHSASARVRVADFGFSRTVRAYEDFYATLLSPSAASAAVRTFADHSRSHSREASPLTA